MTAIVARGRWLIVDPATLPEHGLVENGAVAVEGGKVVAAGTYREVRSEWPGAREIGSEHHLVLPGLINAHHHGRGLTSAQLGVLDDALAPLLVDFACMRPIDAYLDTAYSAAQLIRSGVTTVIVGGFPRDPGEYAAEIGDSLQAYHDVGIRVSFGVELMDQHNFAPTVSDEDFIDSLPADAAESLIAAMSAFNSLSVDETFALVESLHKEYLSHPRIDILLAPVAPQLCSDDMLRRVRQVATDLGTGIQMHCLESMYVARITRARYGRSAVEHLHELGVLGPDVSLAHGVWISERDCELCASTATSICHNPSSNLRVQAGVLPTSGLLARGVNVAIGTDGMSLNDDEDLLQELRLAAKLGQLEGGVTDGPAISSFDALRMATTNAAHAALRAGAIGRLCVGCEADLVLVDTTRLSGPYLDPRLNVIDSLLYRARGADVDTVMIGGTLVMEDRRLLTIDAPQLEASLRASALAEPTEEFMRFREALATVRANVVTAYADVLDGDDEPWLKVNSRK